MARRIPRRRGILLLIVLSLLVLFVLIGVTFIVVSTQYTTAAKAFARHELRGDSPRKELNSAAYMLLRGTRNPADLLYRHNLLGDLYGRAGFASKVLRSVIEPAGAPEPTGLLRIDFSLQEVIGTPSPAEGYYSGSVLTITDGLGRGQSTRIVGYRRSLNDPTVYSLLVEAFDQPPGYTGAPFLPSARQSFLVNDRPFNGTGDGYFNGETTGPGAVRDGTPGALDAKVPYPGITDPVLELALLPDYPFYLPFYPSPANPATVVPFDAAGGWDESWDAVDYQNFFLADVPTGGTSVTPSFHRPYLIRYWMHRLDDGSNPLVPSGGAAGEPISWDNPLANDLRRYVVARPLPQPDEHPFFTGSNPSLTATYQSDSRGNLTLLTDPDGDGLPDGPDPDGIPDFYDVEDESNGQIRDNVPLVSGPWDVDNDGDGNPDSVWVDFGAPIKVTDDGRMYKPLFAVLCVDLDGRLNVNAHGSDQYALVRNPLTGIPAGTTSKTEIEVTRGLGTGPADIRLDIVPGVNFDLLQAQRYAGLTDPARVPGETGPDRLSFMKRWDARQNPRNVVDLHGVGGVYLSGNGHPAVVAPNWALPDDPYETNLLSPQAGDEIFGIDELEKLLRAYDMNSIALPARLAALLDTTDPNTLRRFTTDSYEIPVVTSAPSNEEWREDYGVNTTAASMVETILREHDFADGEADQEQLLMEQVKLMVPYELRMGRRMDVNRPLEVPRGFTSYWEGTPLQAMAEFAAGRPALHQVQQ